MFCGNLNGKCRRSGAKAVFLFFCGMCTAETLSPALNTSPR